MPIKLNLLLQLPPTLRILPVFSVYNLVRQMLSVGIKTLCLNPTPLLPAVWPQTSDATSLSLGSSPDGCP